VLLLRPLPPCCDMLLYPPGAPPPPPPPPLCPSNMGESDTMPFTVDGEGQCDPPAPPPPPLVSGVAGLLVPAPAPPLGSTTYVRRPKKETTFHAYDTVAHGLPETSSNRLDMV
jgi:hypothetical protein